MIRGFAFLFVCLLTAFTASCSVGPRFRQAELHGKAVTDKKEWKNLSELSSLPQKMNEDWWKQFHDPYLERLITEALNSNIDLKVRLLRVQEAGIGLDETKAGGFPRISGSANTSLYRRQSVQYPDILDNQEAIEGRQEEEVASISDSEYYNTGLTVSWELDLWGKKKKNYLVKQLSYKDSQAQYYGERLKVISEIANGYFDIRKKDKEKRILEEIHDNNIEKYHIYDNQFQEGLKQGWQVLRQNAEVKNNENELRSLALSRKRLENQLAILLGKPPGNFSMPDTAEFSPPNFVEVPPGLPSDLLSRRPDIIAAEYSVEKAFHQIGIAQANRMPSISLSGQAGLASTSLSNILRQWSLGFSPLINIPLFDGGASKLRVESEKIRARIAEEDYRKTVYRAFEEIENALANLSDRKKQKQSHVEKLETAKTIFQQTAEKEAMGLVSQLEILDIQRELMNTQKTMLETERMIFNDTITLYKALGGGWNRTKAPQMEVSLIKGKEHEDIDIMKNKTETDEFSTEQKEIVSVPFVELGDLSIDHKKTTDGGKRQKSS